MDQAGIIRDLLSWLEGHLDQPLSLDNVAAKAGYSKWHLQRMFKEVTSHAIGAYIRARRLSKAAVALRLTGRPILDIALQYRFDSQQTFTRAFKKQFNQTPALYRRSEEWDSTGIRPPIRLGKWDMPLPRYITLPSMHLVGTTQSYSCTLEQISSFRFEMRVHFWRQYLGEAKRIPPVLYGLSYTQPSNEKDDEQEVFYTTAIEPRNVPDNIEGGQPVELEGGDYAQFIYDGPPDGLQSFILSLYGTSLPTLNMTRRKGHDIERFFPEEKVQKEGAPNGSIPQIIRCEYLIPVRR
ncbi:MDR efflux pump AcrAB transcriptional activator RobA [Martelella alba]|uniref:MDR efflux pump AcrAB transcriptional activator RobA n=1 Tax=Martelella alba TaxID=2590451 RepID=A0ABY2SR51_9HYPH|nr:MDR efflux pump AcrAB transcriptional activator RobA [Martelella alba]TKI08697.1 MDR efflux pump AcrAB transcriptional activator RobA [Martelella alba]